MIISGSLSIRGKSTLSASSKVNLTGKVKITGKSKVNIFWLNMMSRSYFYIGASIIQRGGAAAMNGVSSLSAELVKVGKEFFRKAAIAGEAIYSITLEGGGGEFVMVNQDIIMTSGDYLEINVSITDEDRIPKDISGCNFYFVCGEISKSIGNGISITDAVSGKVTIILTETDTVNIYGKYAHQIRMIDAQNHPTTIAKGVVTINKGVQ